MPGTLLLGAGLPEVETVLHHAESDRIVDRAILVPVGSLNFETALDWGRQLAHSYLRKKSVVTILVSENELDLRYSLYHRADDIGSLSSLDQTGLSRLIEAIKRKGPPRHPVARVMIIGDKAVLSYRDQHGLQHHSLAGTKHGLQLRASGVDYELLHVSLSEAGKAVAPSMRHGVRFFLQTGPRISISSCIALARQLSALAGRTSVSMLVRPDPWFLDQPDYPGFPAFARDTKIVSAAEYLLAPHVSCTVDAAQRVRCSGSGFFP